MLPSEDTLTGSSYNTYKDLKNSLNLCNSSTNIVLSENMDDHIDILENWCKENIHLSGNESCRTFTSGLSKTLPNIDKLIKENYNCNKQHNKYYVEQQHLNMLLKNKPKNLRLNEQMSQQQTKPPIQTYKSEETYEPSNSKIKFQSAKQMLLKNACNRKYIQERGGGHNKFISPILSVDDKREELKLEDNNELESEHLKNIDPKMVELIQNEIIDNKVAIDWDDIAGLHLAKEVIQEAVVWPLLRPDIFTGLRKPPKGILLFGPPGTGKTLIGKCIASQSKATFFNISASCLTSKWIGDGEKMVRALFAVARNYQPAVIFIDEIDSLLTQRSDNEHEASRRIKTEFLVQFEGAGINDEERLLIIGATNRPQELDEAARRRFVKRIYIPLPDLEARKAMIRNLMKDEKNDLTDIHIDEICNLSDGYSGADMKSLCSEASMGPIRSLPLSQILKIEKHMVRPVSVEDFKNALGRVKPSVNQNDLGHYHTWNNLYGLGY